MNTIKHYKEFFKLEAIDENDQIYLDWAAALIEDYKAERAKCEPTHKQILEIEEIEKAKVIEQFSQIEIIAPKSKKEGFTKKQYIDHIFRLGFHSVIKFLFEHKKRNDKEFAKIIKISDGEIQKMIDEAIEKHKPSN